MDYCAFKSPGLQLSLHRWIIHQHQATACVSLPSSAFIRAFGGYWLPAIPCKTVYRRNGLWMDWPITFISFLAPSTVIASSDDCHYRDPAWCTSPSPHLVSADYFVPVTNTRRLSLYGITSMGARMTLSIQYHVWSKSGWTFAYLYFPLHWVSMKCLVIPILRVFLQCTLLLFYFVSIVGTTLLHALKVGHLEKVSPDSGTYGYHW